MNIVTVDRKKAILRREIEINGNAAQLAASIGSLAELTQAITQWMRYGALSESAGERVREAMAGSGVALEQLSLIFGEVKELEHSELQRRALALGMKG